MRFRIFAMVLTSLLLHASLAWAEAPFSFDATPGKLPKDVVPESYVVHLVPDLQAHTFKGEETVQIKVRTTTSKVVLNALNLDIASASLTGVGIGGQSLKPELDATDQTLTFSLAKPLQPGRYALFIRYSGLINPQPQGLFYDRYPTASGDKNLIGTQMEPTDARRMLPCWDEPVFRASFQLSVDLPANLATFSNTPVLSREVLPGGLQKTTFGPTPKMASYLVVLVAGELDRITAMQDGIQIGVVTTEGKEASAKYTLAITQELLHYYNDYFGIKFLLPKLDQIATPGGFEGAMENWGGIVYNDNTVLYDPLKSSTGTKQDVYLTVAHEMAHQWFGDLVTTAWWDNLWLNEGFASWMSTKATDHFNPDWDFWPHANAERERAMALDARQSTHPIQQPVHNESEANDAFDDITYLKGQSFLRMLETWLGEDDFRTGIRAYMQAHRYSSTTTADLWAALEKASGKPVAKLAADWTQQPGFPIVNVDAVCERGKRKVTLTQTQFKLDDDMPGARLWTIPVAIGTVGGKSAYSLISGRSKTVTMPGCDGTLVIDPDAVGYYRVEYSQPLLEALRKDFDTLPGNVRLKLLSDSWALVSAKREPVSVYLDLVSNLGAERHGALWERVLAPLDTLDELAAGTPVRTALRSNAIRLLTPTFAALGWEPKAGEPFQDTQLRDELLVALGHYGDQDVIAEARRRFAKFLIDPSSLPATIAGPVIAIVGCHADEPTYVALLKLAHSAIATEDRERYYRALASAEDPALAAKTLLLALASETPVLLANRIVELVAEDHLDLAWTFAKANGPALLANVAEFARNGYFPGILRAASDEAIASDLEAYVAATLPPDAVTLAHRTADSIRLRGKLKAELLPQLAATLK